MRFYYRCVPMIGRFGHIFVTKACLATPIGGIATSWSCSTVADRHEAVLQVQIHHRCKSGEY